MYYLLFICYLMMCIQIVFRNTHTRNLDYPIYEAFCSNKNISNAMGRIGIDCIQER